MRLVTTHATLISARCPRGTSDAYEVEFEVRDALIEVERIEEVLAAATAEPVYQEDLTQQLAHTLGCIVTTRGRPGRFATVCCADPEAPP